METHIQQRFKQRLGERFTAETKKELRQLILDKKVRVLRKEEVAKAAVPPIDKLAAVPVKPVPGPLNCVLALIVVPPKVVNAPV